MAVAIGLAKSLDAVVARDAARQRRWRRPSRKAPPYTGPNDPEHIEPDEPPDEP